MRGQENVRSTPDGSRVGPTIPMKGQEDFRLARRET